MIQYLILSHHKEQELQAEVTNRFNVLFANSSQTQHDIKKNRGFICLFNPNDSLEELEHNLKQSIGA